MIFLGLDASLKFSKSSAVARRIKPSKSYLSSAFISSVIIGDGGVTEME
jgi:hypothetical protein